MWEKYEEYEEGIKNHSIFLGVKKGANLATTRFTPFIAEREGSELC